MRTARTQSSTRQWPPRHWLVRWCRAARRPRLTVAALIAVTLTLILAITAAAGIQEPEVHDELTMLAMADIYSHGRMCEPTHPHWQHFETNYLLAHPCVQGKYPPGLPLYMTLGRLLTGEFITGVWLAVAVMIASTAYAMYGWLPPRWALVGTVLVALRFGVAGDWAHSYWGGAVAAAGGALVFGAVRRLTMSPAGRDGMLLGAGLVMLAFSRPYEGLAYSLPALALVLMRLARPWRGRRRLWLAMPALVAVVAAGLGWHAYDNARVTGSPLTLPYVLYERTYTASPMFVFQDFRARPAIRNAEMAGVEQYLTHEATLSRTNWPINKGGRLAWALWDLLKPTLPLALIGLIGFRRWRGARRLALISLVLMLAGAAVTSPAPAPRYLAPAVPALFLMVTVGLAGLTRRRFEPAGRAVAAAILVAFAAAVIIAAGSYVHGARTSQKWTEGKRDIRQRLVASAGQDLVFVRYDSGHSPHDEWVYNGADIDRQPIVWARELGPHADAAIRRYFQGRRAWVVLADARPPRLVPLQNQPSP